jgi:hypothetical protein
MVLEIKHTHVRRCCQQPRAAAVGGAGSRPPIFFLGRRLRLDDVAPLLDQVFMAPTGITFIDTAMIITKQSLCSLNHTMCCCDLLSSLRAPTSDVVTQPARGGGRQCPAPGLQGGRCRCVVTHGVAFCFMPRFAGAVLALEMVHGSMTYRCASRHRLHPFPANRSKFSFCLFPPALRCRPLPPAPSSLPL